MPSITLQQRPIRIVLVETSHPGNIGSVARAMKTMNMVDLHLVKPKVFPHADATAMASGADDLLARASRWDSLDQAVADCGLVLGASARLRSLTWPIESPPAAAAKALKESEQHPVALVFGRERTGLTNDELALCHALIHIPSNPEFSSLNLAMAVQVMCYELMMIDNNPDRLARVLLANDDHRSNHANGQFLSEGGRQHDITPQSQSATASKTNVSAVVKSAERRAEPACNEAVHTHNKGVVPATPGSAKLATSEQMNYFYQHLQQVMIDTGFLDPSAPKHLMRRLRRLFGRARPDETEINILRGVLSAVQKYGKKS